MSVIVVASPREGVDKRTLAPQIAGVLANRGRPAMPGDLDRHHSARPVWPA